MNYTQYAQFLNANEEVIYWVEHNLKNYLETHKPTQSEVEHIIDYLASKEAPTRLKKMSYKQAKENAKKWNETLQKKGKEIKETEKDVEVIHDFKDGFKIVKLIGENAYKREGNLMGHCVSSYFGKDDEIYSLRDNKNMPHCTMSKSSQQIKGKGNGSINPKYIKYVVKFLELSGIEVRDSEMRNLGYVNVEEIIKEDKKVKFDGLFNKEYFFKNDLEKVTKDGEKYENLTMWKLFGLFEFNSKLEVKFNFDVQNSINTFRQYLKGKIKKAGGYRAQLASGDEAQLAGGDRAQLAGGDYAQLAGGDYAQLAGGDRAQLAGGDRAQLAGGDRAQLAGGDEAQLAGGDRAQLAGGDEAQLAGGYRAQLAGGDRAQLAGGDRAQLAGGYRAQLAGGDYAQLVLNGKNAIGIAGKKSKIKGVIGSWIVLTDYDEDYNIVGVYSAQIDGKKLKEDVYYKLENKKFVEVN